MGFRLEISLLCVINIAWIQPSLSDGPSTNSEAKKWTCSCSIPDQKILNSVPRNCSSCDCSPVSSRSSDNTWTCTCSVGQLPRLVGSRENSSSCFTACNCNAGTVSELEPSKKQISRTVVLIVLLLCVVLTAVAFIASALMYAYRKDSHSFQWTPPQSDGITTCGSATDLMSQGGSSLTAHKGYLNSSRNHFLGCIPKSFFILRGRTGEVHATILRFSYSDLESATNRFSDSNLIGVGGSSHVYRGSLRDGTTVAIKRMRAHSGSDEEQELIFLTEIELISRLHHCHLVPLLGYCLENQGKNVQRLLVFEFIPNGNLRECLDGDTGPSLDWNTRVSIALGAARGLEYLHEAAAPRILHRDVKSTNILLDEMWRAKITDLGMAKHLQNDGMLSCSGSPARMEGTFGYFAPEYAIIGRASLKSDVFSFGVVLLELITGRKPIYKSYNNKGAESLVIWAMPRLNDSKQVITELPDPRLEGKFQEEEMQVIAYLAKECLLLDPDSRPSMSEVVQILSTIAPVRSKRHAFQFSSVDAMESGNPEADNVSAAEDIKQMTCVADQMDARLEDDVEKGTLPTSKKCRSWSDVDLTEPRLESFRVPGVDSHIVTIA